MKTQQKNTPYDYIPSLLKLCNDEMTEIFIYIYAITRCLTKRDLQ